jgi:hypothetical protein
MCMCVVSYVYISELLSATLLISALNASVQRPNSMLVAVKDHLLASVLSTCSALNDIEYV